MPLPLPPITADNVAAHMALRYAQETAQMQEVYDRLGYLLGLRKMGLRCTNKNLLWAEWHYAKAMHVLYSDDGTRDMLDDANAALGVDDDGDEVSA
jgi:hypothetical protein